MQSILGDVFSVLFRHRSGCLLTAAVKIERTPFHFAAAFQPVEVDHLVVLVDGQSPFMIRGGTQDTLSFLGVQCSEVEDGVVPLTAFVKAQDVEALLYSAGRGGRGHAKVRTMTSSQCALDVRVVGSCLAMSWNHSGCLITCPTRATPVTLTTRPGQRTKSSANATCSCPSK